MGNTEAVTVSDLGETNKTTFESLRAVNKTSTSFQKILNLAEKNVWRKLRDPILLLGETGTGKTSLAMAIHNKGKEKNFITGEFVPVLCSGIPEELLESEIFGHLKGAFTGALKDRKGAVKSAEKGTLFLDEIGELSLASQSKLLKVIGDKKFTPLGDDEEKPADIQIIAATNKSLSELKDPKIFRLDLLYRMSNFIEIPSLRDQIKESAGREIIDHIGSGQARKLYNDLFLNNMPTPKWYNKKNQQPRVNPEIYDILLNYHWPGNFRELKSVIKGMFDLAALEKDLEEITKDYIPQFFWKAKTVGESNKEIENSTLQELSKKGLSLEAVEKAYILQVYKDLNHGRNTASQLKISPTTLNSKLEEYGVK